MEDYETRKQAHIDRMHELAAKNAAASTQTLNHARQMADCIPFGQPILVGHYSESGDRNFRNRIQSGYEKGFELQKKANYYADRAATAESNHTISSDDPTAIEQLQAKIKKAEEVQARMTTFNKLLRKQDHAGMLAAGFTEEQITKLSQPDFCGRVGFPSYALTNNNANIRRMKERLGQISKHSNDTTTKKTIGKVNIIDNVELNRLQIAFPDKPSDEIRELLKSYGFRWCPSEGTWQRQRSNQANYAANTVVNKYNESAHS